MKKLLYFLIALSHNLLWAQTSVDTVKVQQEIGQADDPSQFLTRIELFNDLQHYDEQDFYYNKTVLRTIVKIGRRFTTRLDLPFIYNTRTSDGYTKQAGLGDISFRLLGYKIKETPRSAFTASLEISLNTAESPLLGFGKNVLIPMVSYTRKIPKEKMLLAMVLQQSNSVSGDETRDNLNFTKLELIALKAWSRRFWAVLAPEWYMDYIHNSLSMNLRTRVTYAPTPRMNIWITPSAGIFGDFIGRYQWSVEIGGRYFMFREMDFKKASGR